MLAFTPGPAARYPLAQQSGTRQWLLSALLVCVFWASNALAVEIPFTNCAPGLVDSPLGFTPTKVDASCTTDSGFLLAGQTALQFTVYGFMNGSVEDLNPATNKYSKLWTRPIIL